jgi:hypothetical protein
VKQTGLLDPKLCLPSASSLASVPLAACDTAGAWLFTTLLEALDGTDDDD